MVDVARGVTEEDLQLLEHIRHQRATYGLRYGWQYAVGRRIGMPEAEVVRRVAVLEDSGLLDGGQDREPTLEEIEEFNWRKVAVKAAKDLSMAFGTEGWLSYDDLTRVLGDEIGGTSLDQRAKDAKRRARRARRPRKAN